MGLTSFVKEWWHKLTAKTGQESSAKPDADAGEDLKPDAANVERPPDQSGT
jgi:hypothetical protein